MRTDLFDYRLDPALVAQEPSPRGESRLLHQQSDGFCSHKRFADFADLVHKEDLLVVNNTKVFPARLYGRRSGGGRAELLLIEETQPRTWRCLVKPRKRLRPGALVTFAEGLEAKVLNHLDQGEALVRFSEDPLPLLEALGHVPLPPYIRRPAGPDRPKDRLDYQTVYARHPGAVAAPTAGLHFSTEILETLKGRAVGIAEITLHVGPGTFRPVASAEVEGHKMRSETFEVTREAAELIEETRRGSGRILAVGTTVVRTLETVAAKHEGHILPARGQTDLFVYPGFEFRIIDGLLTNFHLPRSTLLMLVCAFGGYDAVMAAYRQAIKNRYRFFSYGDAMFLERPDPIPFRRGARKPGAD